MKSARSKLQSVVVLNETIGWKFATGDSVYSVAITPDGSWVVAGTGYNIYLLDAKGKLVWKYETEGDVDSVAITPDGSRIVAGSNDDNVYLFANLKGLIQITKEKLQEAKKLSVDVFSAEDLLKQAQIVFNKYEYTKAKELAKQSSDLTDKKIKESVPKLSAVFSSLPAFNTWGIWKVEVKNKGVTTAYDIKIVLTGDLELKKCQIQSL